MRSDPITAGAIGALLVMASSGQAGAYQEDEYPDTPEQDAVARVSELLVRKNGDNTSICKTSRRARRVS